MICKASSSLLNRSVKVPKSKPSCSCSSSNQPVPMPNGAALADDVQRGDDLGEQRRIAVGVAGHQRAQLDVLGCGRQPAEGGIRLQHRLVGGSEPGQLIEVVHHEDGVEAGRIGFLRLGDDCGEQLFDARAVREVGDLKSEFDGHVVHVTTTKRGEHPV
jgi:hypothetical protein